ncbi:uncharacterized protein [Typha latifolia]|uniref:uncharacterized protein n=1 Tax=Typha latifolia TaxID=4733 RepID=UPI003C2AFEC1
MSNSEEVEEEEEFYESLDRILSSSCSSTSASDDDAAEHGGRHRRRFPTVSSLDVWIAEPEPVEERRRRLLRRLGLAGDGALGRLGSAALDGEVLASGGGGAAVVRSRSDGSVDPNLVNRPNIQQQHRHQKSVHFPISAKPPLVGRSRPLSAGNLEVEKVSDGESGDEDPRCLIKNLDNGSEFVVKEFREDGMWKKLREVGTGRQLTMEEFEMCVGRSPIVQELMRRQNVEDSGNGGNSGGSSGPRTGSGTTNGMRSKKRGSWLRSIKNVAGAVVARERRSSDERDTSSEKGGRRSSSATDDSQDGFPHSLHQGPERAKVRQYGKSHKELSGLYMSQEIQAHSGSIWSIKFSLDGQYLASAGEDCVIHVWEVLKFERKGEFLMEKAPEETVSCNPFVIAVCNGSPEPVGLTGIEGNHWERKRRAKVPGSRKSVSSDHLMVPEHVFALSEKPVCSFRGHVDDVLDLSWSKSQYLLSSSMDKTVRLWHMSSKSCLKIFSHSDFVTCIQFNPVDDRYFISGSLDEKVRIWSIPDRQVVDWNDLHEMVTAACYAPDGQSALVGSHKGSCQLYDTSDNKLLQKSQIDLENKRRKSSHKKITGFQFAPRNSSKVLITSADSRIRVIDGVELVHKFQGFRNTNSQISAGLTANGRYVVCASEDSHVYVWRYDDDSRPSKSKGVVITRSYEHFHCRDVTVAVPWQSASTGMALEMNSSKQNGLGGESKDNPLSSLPAYKSSKLQCSVRNANSNHYGDRVSATWPEELMAANKWSPNSDVDLIVKGGLPAQSRSAWGLVIVTAGRGGEIRTFQNLGFPVRV